MILEIFDDTTQMHFLTMWKMFGMGSSMLGLGEDDYKSLMTFFIQDGVDASKELYDILIKYIPDNEKKTTSLQSVDPT